MFFFRYLFVIFLICFFFFFLDEDVQVAKGKTKADKKPWTCIEEVALAKAWVHISTCKKVGNEQGREKFWERISEHFKYTRF